ncbi:unnamed protein product [Lactuca virosa]|uniref:RRM domain-containing protein n=1 Tax=Lactuca virosa TaxID=75947 RepID=A0AAU9PBA6_9ASTR|nr:unnamed protein product [Lactuca virosa]
MGEGWTQVRQRKAPANHRFGLEETSFFVSNIPTGATKDEFRKIFNSFGKLTDIYFGGRKGKNGKNFGFIRYSGVDDKRTLEAKLNGTVCRSNKLEINIAKHERTLPKTNNRKFQSSIPFKVNVGGGFVGNRSYAEVAGAGAEPEIPQNQSPVNPPIRLQVDDRMMRLTTGNCLIGEVKTLDHLGHLPALMSIYSDAGVKVKYAGGMKAIIAFDSATLATNFLKIEDNWKSIFNYLKAGVDVDYNFERVASIRIVGLPIRLWCEENFSAIVQKFGKIIIPFDHIEDRLDLSVVKVGILTCTKKKINEEIRVEAEGKIFDVGLVEYEDEPWFPFRFDNDEQSFEPETDYVTSEDELDDEVDDVSGDDEDGVSDTWMGDIEEGEIVGEEMIDGAGDGGCSDDHGAKKISPAQKSPTASESQQAHACSSDGEAETTHGKKKELSKVDDSKEARDGKNNEPGQVAGTPNGSHGPIMDHSLLGHHKPISFPSNLAQSGCFGPFPSKAITSLPGSQILQIQANEIGRSSKKRRRSRSKSPKFDLSGFPVHNLFNEGEEHTSVVGHHRSSREQSLSPKPPGSNNAPRTNEIEATAEVGAMIGFEIDATNKLLAEILGGNGEINVP